MVNLLDDWDNDNERSAYDSAIGVLTFGGVLLGLGALLIAIRAMVIGYL